MLRRLGYACVCRGLEQCSPRGTILRNASPERLRALTATNLDGLQRVLEFNVARGVRMFRISSDIVPFGSHPVNATAWWDEFAEPLADVGALIRREHMRVSLHPGQYTVLSSPDQRILDAARADLVFHARLLDALGLDVRHKIVIHVGGAYGDKVAALQRWSAAVNQLSEAIRSRLVLENDERLFGADDVLNASAATGVPVVVDVLHHRIFAGSGADDTLADIMRSAARTWQPTRDGVPKIHYSTQALGQRAGAHAEFIDPVEFARFLTLAPEDIQFDCMLEAKAKDAALFRLRDALESLA
ncbi:MAG: UV DNA damage repair endonuclease UvsE [Chloroflexota bacterium]